MMCLVASEEKFVVGLRFKFKVLVSAASLQLGLQPFGQHRASAIKRLLSPFSYFQKQCLAFHIRHPTRKSLAVLAP
jgi:hypothetical protein